MVTRVIAALLIGAIAAPAAAQQNLDAVEVRTQVVRPGIAVLFGAGGNIAVNHGTDGTIVIDDQFAPLTDRINAAITALGATPPRFLINTHWHGDHTGGNENFGRAGAIIMAQEHVRDRMASEQRRGTRITPPSPPAGLPIITYHDGISVYQNGGEIRMIHAPHAHTDGDSIVWFVGANVFHMGDLYFNQISLPFIDLDSGGNARGVLAAANRVLELSNDQSVIVPGHGPVATRADLIGYRDMLAEVIGIVERQKAAGITLEQVIAMRPAGRWDINPDAFIKGDAFVTAIWNSLSADAHDRASPMSTAEGTEPMQHSH